MNRFTLSHDSVTRHSSPEVSSTAFRASPPDLPPAVLMDVGFAAFRPLARCRRPHHPVLIHRLAPLFHASFGPRLATTPLRFAITSPPSGCEEDFHLQAVDHARHTKKASCLRRRLFAGWASGHCARRPENYLAGAWSGEVEVEASCSRSFFNRLISTRPPLVRLVLGCSSVLALGTGALPMPTT